MESIKRQKYPTEAEEQATVIAWCDWMKIPVYHVPNGGSRDIREATNLKRQGVKAGVPDLVIPIARGGKHGLYLEMKRTGPKKGVVSKSQKYWINTLIEEGYAVYVAYGAEQAIGCIRNYLRGVPDAD